MQKKGIYRKNKKKVSFNLLLFVYLLVCLFVYLSDFNVFLYLEEIEKERMVKVHHSKWWLKLNDWNRNSKKCIIKHRVLHRTMNRTKILRGKLKNVDIRCCSHAFSVLCLHMVFTCIIFFQTICNDQQPRHTLSSPSTSPTSFLIIFGFLLTFHLLLLNE